MLTMTIWCIGTCLEVLLLWRGLRQRLFSRFPVFYFYLSFVTLNEFVRMWVYRWRPHTYFEVYWITQYVGLALGCGMLFEIYRVALRSFPGAAKMTRYLLLVVFIAILTRTLTLPSGDLIAWLASSSLVLERDLRIVQALAIFALVSLFLWYAIPFGKNLKGILIGYSLFVGMSILQYAMWRYSWDRIRPFWVYAETASYLLVLGVWAQAMWTAQTISNADKIAFTDYDVLAASTRNQFRRALARLGWAARA
jgi:hypothetical protein